MIKNIWNWIWNPPTDGPRSSLMVRLMAGGVFLSEGIVKFVYPNQGIGRFTKLGFAFPGPTAHFVAYVEIIGGCLFIVGWLTRPVAIAFIIEMIVAILSTKISLYMGKSPLPLPPSPPQFGFWAVMHETRSDYAQIMCSLFLLLAGPGSLSLDAKAKGTSKGTFSSRLAAVAALLLISCGAARASGTDSAGADATPVEASHFAEGREAIERKDYKAAEHDFERALANDPHNPDVLNMLAFSERKQGKLNDAFGHYEQALALRPQFPEAREYLAEAYIQAASKELKTLRGYGATGKEESTEVVEKFIEASKEAD